MRKRIAANLYTHTKTIWRNSQQALIYEDEGYLFSQGKYKTKIMPEDLPEWFVSGYFYRHQGYLSAKGVKYLVYKPNFTFNHMFKDDFLYISYNRAIAPVDQNDSVFKFEGFDEHIWGSGIVDFLKAAEKYSNYDISQIKVAIEKNLNLILWK